MPDLGLGEEWDLLLRCLKAESPPRQREAFQISGLTPRKPAVKLAPTLVRRPVPGQAFRKKGKWNTKESGKQLREIRHFFEQPKYADQPDIEWAPMRITPDLVGLAVQAAKPRTVLVPPSSFEHRLRADTRFRLDQKAELMKQGIFADRIDEVLRVLEEQRAQEREIEKVKERARSREGAASFEHSELEDRPLPGSCGFTRKHRTYVKRACGVLSEYRDRLGFFTSTLCPRVLEALAWVPNGWNRVVTDFRRWLSRLMKSRGLPLLAVDVTEIQLKRFARTGEPAPHLHMAFVIRNGRGANDKWLVSKEELHEAWNRIACRVAMLEEVEYSRTEVTGVEYDVHGYLSKYLSKGADVSTIPWEKWVGIRPSRWWNQTPALKAAVDARTVVVPGNVVRFIELNRQVLLDQGLVKVFRRGAPADKPIGEIALTVFASRSAIRDVLYLYLQSLKRSRDSAPLPLEVIDGQGDERLPVCLSVPSGDFEANSLPTIPVCHAGCFPECTRESLELRFRNVQIPEPVFLGALGLPEERTMQLELLGKSRLAA